MLKRALLIIVGVVAGGFWLQAQQTVNAPKAPTVIAPAAGGSISTRWPLVTVTSPIDAQFSWVNQGGASVDVTSAGIYLQAPVAASTNLRVRVKSAPATPYTITAAFVSTLVTASLQDAGLVFRESSTGKMVVFQLASLGTYVTTASGPTALVTNLMGPLGLTGSWPAFWRIADDGVNLTYSQSIDGAHFVALYQASRTGYLTGGPDQVGFFVNEQTNTYVAGMLLLSWSQS